MLTVSRQCELMDLSRSSLYYQPADEDHYNLLLMRLLDEQFTRTPFYGVPKMTAWLRTQGHLVNPKRIRRLLRLMGLEAVYPKPRLSIPSQEHKHYPYLLRHLVIDRPDQVWAADITYIRLLSEFVYLAVILDIFTRKVLGWCLSRQLDQELTLAALRMALLAGRAPTIHHSDQGVQYAATTYVELLKLNQVQISMAAVGKAEENSFAERFMRTIKEEEVDLSEYRDFADARRQIGYFIEAVYNQKRIHSALDYLTPVEFELAWRLALTQPVQQAPLSRA